MVLGHGYDGQHQSYEKRVEDETTNPEAILDPEQDEVLTGTELEDGILEIKGRRESALYLSPNDPYLVDEPEETEPATDKDIRTDGGTDFQIDQTLEDYENSAVELLQQPPSEAPIDSVYSREETEAREHLDDPRQVIG